ncbi:MAG TPA: CotH kinase family protein, partial [Pseudomonadota bacterium]|nr:CotH kinase family protein [Pseudomonadota bacterium]
KQQYNNANFRGIWGERPVTWQHIAANGAPLFNLDMGLRMAGSPYTRPRYILNGPNGPTPNTTAWSTTNALDKPSMNFYMRDDLGGDPLKYPVIPKSSVASYSDFRFRGGHNDTNPFIIDELARRLFVDMGNKGSLGVNTTLYINGAFKGIFNLVQHVRQEWLKEAFKSDLDWDVLQVGVPSDGDGISYQEMFTFLRNNPQSVLANYQGMQARLDMTAFVDYLILNIYTCTGDWPHNNWIAARERSTTGKFRFFVWDAEGAFGSFGLSVTSNNFVTQPQNNGAPGTQSSLVTTTPQTDSITTGARILYTLLRDSPEFKLLFADRIQKHFFNGGALTDGAITARYNELANECSPFIAGFNSTRVPSWINGVGNSSRWTVTLSGTSIASTTNAPSRRKVLLEGFTNDQAVSYLPAGPVSGYFAAQGLFPATLAPSFGQFGGMVNPGYGLTITNPNAAGTIYYTTSGLDPRLPGGGIQGTAYTGPIPITTVTTVKARVLNSSGEWSPLVEATFRTGTPPTLLISEIMYNPPAFTPPGYTAPVDGDEFEFIELKNTGSAPVNLYNLRLAAGVDFTFPPGATVPAGGFVVLAKNAALFALKYPGVSVAGQYGPGSSLSNSGETITLLDPFGDTIMSFAYNDAAPWPTAADGGGRSLVPVQPNSNPSPNLASSWRASTNLGGSPGADDP